MTSLQEIYDEYVRPLNLRWRIDDNSRRRLIMASALPAFVVAAQLTLVALSYIFSPDELYYGREVGGAGEFWVRLNRAATVAVDTLLPVAIAVLFLVGILGWTRPEGSWMLLAGAGLATLAAWFATMTIVTYAATEDFELIYDIGAEQWPDMARTFGFLSVGYFFVAYRGLATSRRVPAPRRQQPPEGPADESTES